jgi:rhodanese-related sulfurtransferase
MLTSKLKNLIIPRWVLYIAFLVLGVAMGSQLDVAGLSFTPDSIRAFLQPARVSGPDTGETNVTYEWAFRSNGGIPALKEKIIRTAQTSLLISNCGLTDSERALLAKAADRNVAVVLLVRSTDEYDKEWLKENRISASVLDANEKQAVLILDRKSVAYGTCDGDSGHGDSLMQVWNSPAMAAAYGRQMDAVFAAGHNIYQRQAK